MRTIRHYFHISRNHSHEIQSRTLNSIGGNILSPKAVPMSASNPSNSVWVSITTLACIVAAVQMHMYWFPEIFYINSEADVLVNWKNVISRRQYWRILVAHLFHFSRLQAVMNVCSLFCLGRYLNKILRWFPFLLVLQFMGVGSNIIFIFVDKYLLPNASDSGIHGFSYIHFGLRIVIAYVHEPRNYEPSLFLGLYPAYLSALYAPWQPLLELGFLTLIVPDMNLSGQLSGVIAGFLASFLITQIPPYLVYTEQYLRSIRRP